MNIKTNKHIETLPFFTNHRYFAYNVRLTLLFAHKVWADIHFC